MTKFLIILFALFSTIFYPTPTQCTNGGMPERRGKLCAEMRRKDRETGNRGAGVAGAGEYGVLAIVSADGAPYAVPLSYCVIDNGIYFHCAPEGHKLENIAADSRASFCVVVAAGAAGGDFPPAMRASSLPAG